jgi:polyhydroxyalkanoate synthase
VLKATLEEKGENLLRGLENLLRDIDRGQGRRGIRPPARAAAVGRGAVFI